MITRTSLANEIDEYDQQIADMNTGKKDCFDAYRAQLVASGMDKANIKTEIEAVKAAIKRRRAAKKDPMAVEEKDALIDEIFEEITTSPRAPRATRENIEKFDPETGEILEDINPRLAKQIVDGMQTEAGRAALIAAVDILIEREEAEEMDRATEGSFETGSEAAEKGRKAIPAGPEGVDLNHAGVGESPAANSKTDAAISRPGFASLDRPEIENRSGEEPSVSNGSGEMQDEDAIHLPTNSDQPLTGGDHVTVEPTAAISAGALTTRAPAINKYRPHCQRPNMCGSGTKDHCYSCEKAIQEKPEQAQSFLITPGEESEPETAEVVTAISGRADASKVIRPAASDTRENFEVVA